MMHTEVLDMLNKIGLPYAYDHFAEGEAPKPPFICFRYPGNNPFGADNVVYFSSTDMDLEVYTDWKDPELESKIEKILTDRELYYIRTEVWIESEKLYEILYATTI